MVKLTVMESKDKKDLENPGGSDVLKELGGAESGLPFYGFVDAKGKKIADSNVMPGKVKNIGYPAAPEEIDSFESLLKKTAPKMKASDRDRLIAHLRKPSAPTR